MEEGKKKDFGDLCNVDGLSGRKTVKAEFRSLPSSTDPSKKSDFIELSSSPQSTSVKLSRWDLAVSRGHRKRLCPSRGHGHHGHPHTYCRGALQMAVV